MYNRLLVFFVKILIKLLRLFGKNASALPGLIIETLSPDFLSRVLMPVQDKIILITGTNGKTTTTRMVVHALRSSGRSVVTNSTGSNMTRGLISAVVNDMSLVGSLRPTDWFVFEMDEAYAPLFTRTLRVKSVVALNVLRDQLDRYGEIDTTAKLIESAAQKAEVFIFNAHDPLLTKSAQAVAAKKVRVASFGVVNKLTSKIRNEQNMFSKSKVLAGEIDTVLVSVEEKPNQQQVTVSHVSTKLKTSLNLEGLHNAVNATAVCALLAELESTDYQKMFVAINTMHAPFGRGEILHLNNKMVTVALVKNPSGFTHNLETFVENKSPEHILFIVNDRFADGRDVSWLWDVGFKTIPTSTQLTCSGLRAYDMALRLKHDGYHADVVSDVGNAVEQAMQAASSRLTIIPTYTALYEARAALSNYGKVSRIW